MTFRQERTGEIVDPIAHSKEMISQFAKRKKWDDELRIYVGTDSQNTRYSTRYVTVIAYRHGNRGADFIYWKENVKKIKASAKVVVGQDLIRVEVSQRLWGEVERSLAVAQLLNSGDVPVYCVDLDVNDKVGTGSNSLAASGRGYIVGSGFKCSVKPEEQCASRAADHLVRA